MLPGVVMKRLSSLLLLPLVACGASGTSGSWEGVCEFDEENSVDIVMELETDSGDLVGSVVASFDTLGYLYIRSGDVSGTTSGSTVDLNLDFEDGAELDLSGEQDGDVMDGTCTDGDREGDLELERG
jgi:hypothetical protein